jgi:hypothetical protein
VPVKKAMKEEDPRRGGDGFVPMNKGYFSKTMNTF